MPNIYALQCFIKVCIGHLSTFKVVYSIRYLQKVQVLLRFDSILRVQRSRLFRFDSIPKVKQKKNRAYAQFTKVRLYDLSNRIGAWFKPTNTPMRRILL